MAYEQLGPISSIRRVARRLQFTCLLILLAHNGITNSEDAFELAGGIGFAGVASVRNRKYVLMPCQNGKLNKVEMKQKYFPFHLQFSHNFCNEAAGILLPVARQVSWSWGRSGSHGDTQKHA